MSAVSARPAFAGAPLTIIAHRGASGIAPESTRVAFEVARDLGADYLEGDLHRTQDGQIVVVHDDDLAKGDGDRRNTDALDRFPGRASYEVGSFTLAEIKSMDAGSWFNSFFKDRARKLFVPSEGNPYSPRVLTLEELLEIARTPGKNQPGIYLEFKSPEKYPGIEAQVVQILRQHGWLAANASAPLPVSTITGQPAVRVGQSKQRVVFQSFDPSSIQRLRDPSLGLASYVPLLLLGGPDEYKSGEQMIRKALEVGANGVGPRANFFGSNLVVNVFKFTTTIIRPARKAGLFVHPYVVDSSALIRATAAALKTSTVGLSAQRLRMADGIFTNRADIALAALRGRKQAPAEAQAMLDQKQSRIKD